MFCFNQGGAVGALRWSCRSFVALTILRGGFDQFTRGLFNKILLKVPQVSSRVK